MQRIAAEIGFSETAFAAPDGERWRVRYYAPEIEVAFCGHATITLGAALTAKYGDGLYQLVLNNATISVEGKCECSTMSAALQSPETSSKPAHPKLIGDALALFSLTTHHTDFRIPPAIANAGADHLILALDTRRSLRAMKYGLVSGRSLMLHHGITTISLLYAETEVLFHARNAFGAGGVYEDPATGAAAAALGGYLRDLHWPHRGHVDIVQGEDMGLPSRLGVDISPVPGSSIRVFGTARFLT
jgi:PhzF family phenazine biosynthesis protein